MKSYKIMSKNEFEKFDTCLNDYEYNLLKEYYTTNLTIMDLSIKYNYSIPTINKQLKRAKDKINITPSELKELHKTGKIKSRI